MIFYGQGIYLYYIGIWVNFVAMYIARYYWNVCVECCLRKQGWTRCFGDSSSNERDDINPDNQSPIWRDRASIIPSGQCFRLPTILNVVKQPKNIGHYKSKYWTL